MYSGLRRRNSQVLPTAPICSKVNGLNFLTSPAPGCTWCTELEGTPQVREWGTVPPWLCAARQGKKGTAEARAPLVARLHTGMGDYGSARAFAVNPFPDGAAVGSPLKRLWGLTAQ